MQKVNLHSTEILSVTKMVLVNSSTLHRYMEASEKTQFHRHQVLSKQHPEMPATWRGKAQKEETDGGEVTG